MATAVGGRLTTPAGRRATAASTAAVMLLMVAGCGGTGGQASSATTKAPSGVAAPSLSPTQREAAECSRVLTPWTQYIADSNDFAGWVDTVGAHSPVVALPQNAARVYLREEGEEGQASKASVDGFRSLDEACDAFATTKPGFDFHAIPAAPIMPSNN